MLGFETIGNATVIAYDGEPVIATDPWLGDPAYFGSWAPPLEIPEAQRKAILGAKFIWCSHGHPDHLNPESIEKLHGKNILLPDHVGNRIHDTLVEAGYAVTVMADGEWMPLSDNVRVLCLSDYFQDAILLIDVGGTLLVNLNDASDRGWGRRLKRLIRQADRSFLLKLFGYSVTDMMNFFDDDGKRIGPYTAPNRPIGEQVAFYANLFGVTDIVPFSCFHDFQRSDSVWVNDYAVPLGSFHDGYTGCDARIHDAFIRFDVQSGKATPINPPQVSLKILDPKEFGDDWDEPFEAGDQEKAAAYFQSIEPLRDQIDFVRLVAGGQELMIDMAGYKKGGKTNRGVTFETPRHSLMASIEHEIFDDQLIANFMKTQLHGDWEALTLQPYFTPYVAKYADNGRAKTRNELAAYFAEYRKRVPLSHLLHVLERESERRVRKLTGNNTPTFQLMKKTYLFLRRA